MRRMIPQKLIDELTARLEREEQTKEMLKNILVAPGDIEEYSINLSSDGETYLTIAVLAVIETTEECIIELQNIPTEFLSKLKSVGAYPCTNSLGGGCYVGVIPNIQAGYIKLTINAGEPRSVFSTITLSSVNKEI